MQGDSYKNWCPRPDSNWEAEARDFKSLVFAISPRGHKKRGWRERHSPIPLIEIITERCPATE